MRDLCIVTARGGSKRVPRKNVRPLRGKPLVSWAVRAALASGLFDDVLISTDDDEIAQAAMDAGAMFPFRRPAAVADDHSTTSDVLRVALGQWQQLKGALPEYCCCLYGTSAFVTPEDLQAAKRIADAKTCVMAVTEYAHPIQRALEMDDSGSLRYLQPEYTYFRTQDCPPAYHDIGLFYYFSVQAFLEAGGKSFLPLQLKAVQVPRTRAIDIDTEDDWGIAEALAVKNGLL